MPNPDERAPMTPALADHYREALEHLPVASRPFVPMPKPTLTRIGAALNPYALEVMYPMRVQHPRNLCLIQHVVEPGPVSKTIHSLTASEHRGMVRWAQRRGWALRRVSIIDGIIHAAFITQ